MRLRCLNSYEGADFDALNLWCMAIVHTKREPMKNIEQKKLFGCNVGTKEESYKRCPHCFEVLPGSASFCPYCGTKFDTVPEEVNMPPEVSGQEEKRNDYKAILSRKNIVRILLMLVVATDVILAFWGVERIKEFQKTDIIVSTSDLELETGEEAELLIDIKNPPLDYILTYDDNPAVLEEWMDWQENNKRIPLSLIGLKETKDKLHVYIYDRAEYLKKEQEKVVLAEKSIPIIVKPRSDISLSVDKEINLLAGDCDTLMVTVEGELPDDFYLSVSAPESLVTEWGEWINDYQCPISVTGLSASSDVIAISLFDTSVLDEGICLCSVKIKANVQ